MNVSSLLYVPHAPQISLLYCTYLLPIPSSGHQINTKLTWDSLNLCFCYYLSSLRVEDPWHVLCNLSRLFTCNLSRHHSHKCWAVKVRLFARTACRGVGYSCLLVHNLDTRWGNRSWNSVVAVADIAFVVGANRA